MQGSQLRSVSRSGRMVALFVASLVLAGCPLAELFGPQDETVDAPSGLTVVATGRDSVTLTWTEVPGAEGYRVIFNATGSSSDPYETRDFSPGASPWIVDGLSGLDPIFFAVRVLGPDGDGVLSSWVQATLAGAPDVYAYLTGDPDTHLNDGDSVALPATIVGEESELDLLVANSGSEALTVSAVTATGNVDEIRVTSSDGTDVGVPIEIAPGDSCRLLLTFAPAEAGTQSIQLSIESDDPDENPMVLTVSGTATAAAAPDIGVSHPTPSGHVDLANGTGVVDFGDLGLGRSSTYYVDIDNNGTDDLSVSSINIEGTHQSEFSLTSAPSLPLTVPAPDQSLNRFGVVFSPGNLGNKTASLVIRSNDPADDPYVVQLQGAGVDIPASITVNVPNRTLAHGDEVHFDDEEIGATSADESLFVGNRQGTTVDLSVTDVSLSGTDADQFRVSMRAALPVTVEPGTYALGGGPLCFIYFEPTGTGDKTATLTLASNDPDYPEFDVVLTGTGISPPPVPASPALYTPTSGDAQVDLRWLSGDATPVDFYRIYYSQTDDFSTAVAYGSDGTYTEEDVTETVSGLTNDVTYFFWVTAVNSTGESTPSASRQGYPRWSDRPGEVGSVTVVPGDAQFAVTWTPAERATYYDLTYYYRIWQNGSWYVFDNTTVEVDGLSYTATGVKNDMEYRISIMPMNSQGQGLSSGPHLVTPSEAPTGPTNAELAAAVASVYSSLAESVASGTTGATDLDPDPAVIRYEFSYPDGTGGSCDVVYDMTISPSVSTTITYDFNGYTSDGYVFDTATGNELTYILDGASNGTVTGRIDISGDATGYVEYDLTISGGSLSGNYIVNGESIPF